MSKNITRIPHARPAERPRVTGADLLAAADHLPKVDVGQFFSDLDRYVDPTRYANPASRNVQCERAGALPAGHVSGHRPTSSAQITSDAEYLISSITLAELNAGIHAATSPIHRADRLVRLQWVSDTFDPLPFTVSTARMYGQLTALVLAAGRHPRPRRMDLLIASVAAHHRLPLLTHNPADFAGLSPLLILIGLDGQ